MFKYLGVLLVIFLLLKTNAATKEKLNGGSEVSKSEFPHVVCIKHSGYIACSGVILTNRLVLTSCHCVSELRTVYRKTFKSDNLTWVSKIAVKAHNPDNFVVIAGVIYISKNIKEAQIREVQSITLNPKCYYSKGEIPMNDYGVLKVKRGFQFNDNVQKMRLLSPSALYLQINNAIQLNKTCVVVGWGKHKKSNSIIEYVTSSSLLKVDVSFIPEDKCGSKYNETDKLCNGCLMCGSETYKGDCVSDHEGPIICSHFTVGFSTFSSKCQKKQKTAIYSRLGRDISFVTSFLELKEKSLSPLIQGRIDLLVIVLIMYGI